MKAAALYARVSSDRQKENHTISSQVAALIEYADTNGYLVPPEWRFQDEGYSGATLLRPGLEAFESLTATVTDCWMTSSGRPVCGGHCMTYRETGSSRSRSLLSPLNRGGPRWSGVMPLHSPLAS